MKLNENTRLAELNIPYLRLTLEQAFSWPPQEIFPEFAELPTTLGELCTRLDADFEQVKRRLHQLLLHCKDVVISSEQWEKKLEQGALVLETRDDAGNEYPANYPMVVLASARSTFTTMRMFHALEEIRRYQEKNREIELLCLGPRPEDSYSLAMFLREKNVIRSYCPL